MATTTTTAFGRELRRWRDLRRHSQLDLAATADVSQRHLSHLETGRSKPSREMVLCLSQALDLPLRARNELLGAAGFAPIFPERDLNDAGDTQVRQVLQRVLDAHEPAPAYVVDRTWDLVQANAATARLTGLLPDPEAAADAAGGNVLRLLLHPEVLRPHVVNFGEVSAALLQRLRREVAHHGGDDQLAGLLADAEELAGAITPPRVPSARDLAVPLHLDLGGRHLRLLTMIATIGAAHDVTVAELRIETLLPADGDTRDALVELATASGRRGPDEQ